MTSKSIKDLEDELVNAKGLIERIDTLNLLAWELNYIDPARSFDLADQALTLSRGNNTGSVPYSKGVGLSLRTLGEIAKLRCDYGAALSNLLEANAILEALPDLENWLIVSDSLSWSYFNLGNLPMAFDTIFKALKIARENGNTRQEADLLATLGAIYGEVGDKQQSINVLQRALGYLEGTDNLRKRSITYNNLAMTQFEIFAYDDALENAERSLEIARQLNSVDLQSTALDTTGQIYMAKQEYSQAEKYFKQAQEFSTGYGIDPDELVLSLARVAIGQGRFNEAENLLRQSLENVENRGVNRFKYQFHELIARIYEEKNDFQNALEQYKLFHSLKSQVYNEDTQRRLANWIVLQEAEATQIDSEIYHLKNQALLKQISIHRRAMAEMEILATIDSLTGLFNRRHLTTLANYAFNAARYSGQPLVAMMMDIDDFKRVNDNYGHLVGDKVLADVSATIKSSLRARDLLGRYGGEEFVAVLPETELIAGQQVAERIVNNVAEHVTSIEGHQIQVTISIGSVQAKTVDSNFEALLDRSDTALYTAKHLGKNRAKTG
ncbi:MAG TPA: diguanylate cyclase [Anaerolineaceae bacterium]|nr:diguanylate cyclase [Anaerolineaceae bacterium]